MGRPYSQELDQFAETYHWAERQEGLKCLRLYLDRWCGEYAAVVGSGGSTSAAAAVALFRELAHRSPTSAVTPLEFLESINRISPHVLLLSAEGKNKDILAAARASVSADLVTAAVTLTANNPLLEFSEASRGVRAFSFPMDWIKDGYLATNSLLATIFLFYRALFGDESFSQQVGPLLSPERLSARRRYLASVVGLNEIQKRGLLVLYGAEARIFAIDLESKLSEAALAAVQVVDLRQFAHGRHLQLSLRSPSPVVLVVHSASEDRLANATRELLPSISPSIAIQIDGQAIQDTVIAGVVDAMFIIEALAHGAHDPGQPRVPEYGRAIHSLDPVPLLRPKNPLPLIQLAASRKSSRAINLDPDLDSKVCNAAQAYIDRMNSARLKAVICDFDGTLCRTENRFGPIDDAVVGQVSKLIRQGLIFAIATGRGDSLYAELRKSFPADLHARIMVGYYNGSFIATLDQPFEQPTPNPEFAELYAWLTKTACRDLSKPVNELARGGQLSVRVPSPKHSARLRGAIRAWLDRTGRHSWRVYCSGHSVDVLDSETSKRRVVETVSRSYTLDPLTEILRIGDSGSEEGNDFELLSDGISLSCDTVSMDLMSCWNFGPSGNNQTETTSAYFRALTRVDGAFQIRQQFLIDGCGEAREE